MTMHDISKTTPKYCARLAWLFIHVLHIAGVREFIKGLLIDRPWNSDNKFPEQVGKYFN